jgi:hypothetical protein
LRPEQAENNSALTAFDRHLITRIAYAMVVSGLWTRILPRRRDGFDFYEIVGQDGRPSFRVGRLADGNGGKYMLLDLRSGLRRQGKSCAEVLRDIAYVPNSMDMRFGPRP